MTGRRLATASIGVALALFLSLQPAWAVQCALYARAVSGFDLYGAAWTWWRSADGQYARGNQPQPGAALVFKQSRGMPSGHVAIVTAVVNARVIMVEHANWSRIRGRKGGIEKNIAVVDESPANDWSEVRVWYRPVDDYGNKVYPVYGFIYR
jgi:surface antigen